MARDSNLHKQRQQNVWMGRANELKNANQRPEQGAVSKSVQNAMKLYADLGNSRRKATFAFGFEDNQRNQNDSAAKAVVA